MQNEMIDICTFITNKNLGIDVTSSWFQDLWFPLSKRTGSLATTRILSWLGYEGEYKIQRQNFKKLLTNNNIPYEEIDHSDERFLEHQIMQFERSNTDPKVIKQKRWIVMGVREFKKAILRLNTKNAEMVRDYYLNLEEACFEYAEYQARWLQEKAERDQLVLVRQLETRDREIRQQSEEIETKREELERQARFTNKLKDIVSNMKSREKTQILYIATTAAYARQNRFKVGGVKSRVHLKARLSTYNSGRPAGDKMFYAFITETCDYHHLEQRISKVLGDHKDTADAEMYNLHYDSLRPFVEYLADRYDEEIQRHKQLFEALLKETLEKSPTVPEPIILNGAEFRTIRNGEVVAVQKVDFDELEEDEKLPYVKRLLEEFVLFQPQDKTPTRQEFESFAMRVGTKFNKLKFWGYTKTASQELQKSISYR